MHKFSAMLCAILISFYVSAAYAETVSVSGDCVGVKLYTDGLIITDTMTLTDVTGKKINLAAGHGIRKGDIIKKVNGVDATNAEVISKALSDSLTLTVSRNDTEFDVALTPITTKDGPKLGLWLRDSTAGLGTITCIYNGKFVGLGHGICDVDTGNIMPLRQGIIQDCSGFAVIKGTRGTPGAITGAINGKKLGQINANTRFGISGTVLSPSEGKDLDTADKSEIRTGNATILCDVDGKGVREYEIDIKHISPSGNNGKDMVIKIKDKALIEKTGGIVQGMSGAPIIQNGKLIGAVTHVFVNDPTRGYGVFIENMLDEAMKVN